MDSIKKISYGDTQRSSNSEGNISSVNGNRRIASESKFVVTRLEQGYKDEDKLSDSEHISDTIDFKQMEDDFRKFWSNFSNSVMAEPILVVPKNSPVDRKIEDIQIRIREHQTLLKNSNTKMRSISFETERRCLEDFKEMQVGEPPWEGKNSREMCEDSTKRSGKELFQEGNPGVDSLRSTMEEILNNIDKNQLMF